MSLSPCDLKHAAFHADQGKFCLQEKKKNRHVPAHRGPVSVGAQAAHEARLPLLVRTPQLIRDRGNLTARAVRNLSGIKLTQISKLLNLIIQKACSCRSNRDYRGIYCCNKNST